MKAVYLRLTDNDGNVIRTETVFRVKTGMFDKYFEIAEMAENLEKEEDTIKSVRNMYREMKSFIAEVFKGKVTFDEINEYVDQSEIDKIYAEIGEAMTGGAQKN